MYVNTLQGGIPDYLLTREDIKIRLGAKPGNKSIESEIVMAELLGLRNLSETLREELKEHRGW